MKLTQDLAEMLNSKVVRLYESKKWKSWKEMGKEIGVSGSLLNGIYNLKHMAKTRMNNSVVERIDEAYNKHIRMVKKEHNSRFYPNQSEYGEEQKEAEVSEHSDGDLLKGVKSIEVRTEFVDKRGAKIGESKKTYVKEESNHDDTVDSLASSLSSGFTQQNGIFHEHPVITKPVFDNIQLASEAKAEILDALAKYNAWVVKLRECGATELLAHDEKTGQVHLVSVNMQVEV